PDPRPRAAPRQGRGVGAGGKVKQVGRLSRKRLGVGAGRSTEPERTRMPTYEYRCEACEHNFDEFQSINDKPLKKCPQCGRPKLRRVLGAGAGVIFKGSGFYQTDYRSESYRKAARAEQEGAKPAAEKNGTGGTPASPSANGTAGKSGSEGRGKSGGKTSKSGT